MPDYPDVSGDDALTAEDALLVISYINSRLSGSSVPPEGEAQAAIDRDVFASADLVSGNKEAGQARRDTDPAPIFPSALTSAGDTNGPWAIDDNFPRRDLETDRSYRTGSLDGSLANWPAILGPRWSGRHVGEFWMPTADKSDANWAELEDALADLAADVAAALYR